MPRSEAQKFDEGAVWRSRLTRDRRRRVRIIEVKHVPAPRYATRYRVQSLAGGRRSWLWHGTLIKNYEFCPEAG